MKFDVFNEFARIVKPGGFIVVACREVFYQNVKEKADRIFKKLENDGILKRWSIVVYPHHIAEKPGICFVFEKLK